MGENMHANKPLSAVRTVMDYVEQGIQSGVFEDLRLPKESDIAEIVGVSRTPVREAMKILEAVGVIEIRRGIGTFIRPEAASALSHLMMLNIVTNEATTKQLFEARLMVEQAAAEILLKTENEHDISVLTQANEKFRRVAEATDIDYDAVTDLDIEFHKTIFALCGNPIIETIGNLVMEQVRPRIRDSHINEDPRISIEVHEKLIEAIQQKSELAVQQSKLGNAVRENVQNWRDRLDRM